MRVKTLVLVAMLIMQQIAQATVFSCPKKVGKELEAMSATNIWLYNENPKQQALLKPNNGDSDEEPKYWLRAKDKNWSNIWYRCLYANEATVVDLKMEGSFTKCSRVRESSGNVYLQCE